MSRPGWIYVVCDGATEYYKIGRTKDLDKRISNLNTTVPTGVILLTYHYTENVYDLERKLHVLLKERRFRGEWFKLEKGDMEKLIKFCDEYQSN